MSDLFKFMQCLLRGHTYLYIGRVYNGPTDTGEKEYSLQYVCSNCSHYISRSEVE